MADIIEPMCCEVVCSLDGGETDFLCVCACGMTVDNGISFLFDGVPVKGHRSALFLWACCFMLDGIVDTVNRHRCRSSFMWNGF